MPQVTLILGRTNGAEGDTLTVSSDEAARMIARGQAIAASSDSSGDSGDSGGNSPAFDASTDWSVYSYSEIQGFCMDVGIPANQTRVLLVAALALHYS